MEEDAGVTFAEEQSNIVSIDALQQSGVSATDIKKLRDAGFVTVRQLLMFPRKAIIAVKGFSDAKADKVLEGAVKL